MAYRGLVAALPVGTQGFTGTLNPSKAGPGHFLFTDGAEIDNGVIRKEGGAIKLNDLGALEGGAVIVSGINWSPEPGSQYDIIFTSSGKVLRDTGAGTFSHTYVSGLINSRDPPPWFAPGGGEAVGSTRKLFLFSATNQVKVASGTGATMVDIATPAADWATSFPPWGLLHGTRMFAGGNASDPHRLYFSTTGDHGDWTSLGSGTMAIYPGEGDGLSGALSFRGAIILFKYPKGIYVVNTTDPSPTNWTVAPLTRSVGTLNMHTIVQIENDVLYMDRVGDVHRLSATNEFGDVNTSNVGASQDIGPFMRDNMNQSKMRRCQGIWYASKRQAWFAMPRLGSEDNNFRMVVGFSEADEKGTVMPLFFMSRRDVAVSLWMRPDPITGIEQPAIGDNAGFVWLLDQIGRNKDGVAYPITFETSNSDLGYLDPTLATKSKTGQFLELAFEPRGDWFLDVEVFWDDILTDVVQFSMGTSGGATLGNFVLDSDALASGIVKSKREKIVGSGRRIRLVCENGGLNQDISLSQFFLSFVPNDERVSE